MTYDTILYEVDDQGVATITLNRPEVHNAMNEALRRDVRRCFEGLATDDEVRVIVVTGAGGKAFSAGADIREFTAPQVPTVFREQRRRLNFRDAMERCWQPIIAAIGGHCYGGGLELALACDIRIASGDSRLGLTEVDLAIIPGGGGTQRLPRVVGLGRALELIITGREVDAAEALAIGLVNEVVADPAARALELAEAIAAHPQDTMLSDRQAAHAALGLPLDEGLALEARLGRERIATALAGAERFRVRP
jgi:enoyl-CoA hydratase